MTAIRRKNEWLKEVITIEKGEKKIIKT